MGHNSKNRHGSKKINAVSAGPVTKLKQVHPHQKVLVYTYPHRDMEDIIAEVQTSPLYKLGRYVETPELPYLGQLVDVKVEIGENGPEIRMFFEPAPPREATAFLYPEVIHKSEKKQAIYEGKQVSFLLRQESWFEGYLEEGQTIYCDACLETRSAFGGNRYDSHVACNQCVEDFETSYLLESVECFDQWLDNKTLRNFLHRLLN